MKLKAKDAAKLIGIPYRETLVLLNTGVLKGEKIKGRWVVMSINVFRFRSDNQGKIDELKKIYVDMYWQGYNPEYLEKMVEKDFKKRGIKGDHKGFAEKAIIEELLRLKREQKNRAE